MVGEDEGVSEGFGSWDATEGRESVSRERNASTRREEVNEDSPDRF